VVGRENPEGGDRHVYTFYGTQLVAASWKPVRSYDYGQPVFMNAADSNTVITTMEAASDQLASRLGEAGDETSPSNAGPAAFFAPEKAP